MRTLEAAAEQIRSAGSASNGATSTAPAVEETASAADKAIAVAPDNVTAADPAAIQALLMEWGYRAELTTDDNGDPRINSSSGGARFRVEFYGCENGADCMSVAFAAGFDLADGLPLDRANEWNSTKRFSVANLDSEGDPYLTMDVMLSDGGMSKGLFQTYVNRWDVLLGEFTTHIGW